MTKALAKLAKKPFSTKEAKKNGFSRAKLTRMVKASLLERLSRGVYQVVREQFNGKGFGDGSGWGMGSGDGAGHGDGSGGDMYTDLERSYIVATLRCGMPSAICLLSALENYHLTDQITAQTWVLVPVSKRVVSKQLKLVRSRNPQWNIGIRKTKNYWITSLERTLIDCLLYKKMFGHQLVFNALKRAVNENKTKLGFIYDLAKKMGVAHRIQPYIEVMAS